MTIKIKTPPNNLPEPPPIARSVPHSRLTGVAARLSFCREAAKQTHIYE